MFRHSQRLLAGLLVCGALLAAQRPGVWLDVPFVKQQKDACGAASIAMVMQYWQMQPGQPPSAPESSDERRIQLSLYSARAHGIYASDLERYLQDHGFRTFAFHGDWELLKEHLQKGRPLIVALKAGGDLHYVVVVGMDWQRAVILKNDPAQRKLLQQDRLDFEKEWNATGAWTLLALPQGDDQSASP
jgi:ABC-type bacteriocin/lantibiotic exporter with double-glycine peptidase domain